MALSSRLEALEAETDALIAAQAAQSASDVAPPVTETETTVAPPVETLAAPALVETPSTEPTPPVTSDPAEQGAWETRYRVLQGKYNAEIPRLLAEVKALKAKVEAPAPKQLVKPEEIEQYGQPFIDLVQRAAEERFASERSEFTAQIAALTEQVNALAGGVAQSTQASFESDLDSLVPTWRTDDSNPSWKAWLAKYDPEARRIRQDLLDEAISDRDATYVASMLKRWTASQTPAPAPQPTPAPQGHKPSLASLAQPSSSHGSPPAAPAPKTYTKAEVDKFYSDWSRGALTDAQAAPIEQEINAAVAEGRYRNR